MSKWVVVLPVEGDDRHAGEQFVPEITKLIGPNDVKVFDSKTYINGFRKLLKKPDENIITDLLNHSLTIVCLDFEATHLLVLASSPVTLFTLNLLRKQGIENIFWFYKDFRTAEYWRDVVTGYHYFMAVQRGELMKFCVDCRVFYHYLPMASGYEKLIEDLSGEPEKHIDIAFIGTPSTYRISILESLAAAGKSLVIAGKKWDAYNGPLDKYITQKTSVSDEQSLALYQQAKIGLNVSHSDPKSDSENTYVSKRVYDILLSNTLLITEDVPLAGEALNGVHYYSFGSVEELIHQVDEIMNDYQNQLKKCVGNQKHILSEHTYKQRAKQILELTRK
jgi:hypothetical protein